MERWHVKILTLFGCFIIPFICTVLPAKVNKYFEKKGERGKKILSCMMCFGGGVFFATYILHMAPEARLIVEYSLTGPNNISYPVADLIMAAGFFLVLFCEKFILIANKRRNTNTGERCVQFNNANGKTQTKLASHDETLMDEKLRYHIKDVEDLADPNCPLYGSGSCCKDPEEVIIQANATEETGFFGTVEQPASHDGHLHEAAILQDSHSSRSIILLVALSFHRIFEGMSIGLQHTTANVVNLFIAVMCHESVIGFSLGLQFVKNKWTVRRIVIACFLCSLIMPIGVGIGTLMVELGNTSTTIDIVNGILQSLATGTFIYVTFFEILQEEITPDDTSLMKVFCVLVGFVLMAGLSAIPEESPETLTGHDVDLTTVSQINGSFMQNVTTVAN